MKKILLSLLLLPFLAHGYELEGPFNIPIDTAAGGLNADIGVRVSANHAINPLGTNHWGESFTHICIYGHDAETHRANIQALIDAKHFDEMVSTAPVIVGAFDPADVDPDPPPNKPEGFKYNIQECYKALPNPLQVSLVIITPGVYTAEAAEGFKPATIGRHGTVTVGGMIGYERPFFDRWTGGSSTKWRFWGPDKVEIAHLKTKNSGFAIGALNMAVKGVTISHYKSSNGITVDDIRQDVHDARVADHAVLNDYGLREMLVQDVELWYDGQGNAEHPIYAQCENNCLVHIDHVTSCGAKDSHAIKAPAANVAITDSVATWACRHEENELLQGTYGTKVIDLRNSALTFVHGNYIEWALGKYNSNWVVAEAIYYPGRRAISVMNRPFSVHDAEFHQVASWQAILANENNLSDLLTPYSNHIIANNVIHRADLTAIAGERGENSAIAYPIGASSMWPKERYAKFSPLEIYYEFEPEIEQTWLDTGQYYEFGNQYTGLGFTAKFDGKTKLGNSVDANKNQVPLPSAMTDRELLALPDLSSLSPMWLAMIDESVVVPPEPQEPPIEPEPSEPPVVDPPAAKPKAVRLGGAMTTVISNKTGRKAISIKLYKPADADLIIETISE